MVRRKQNPPAGDGSALEAAPNGTVTTTTVTDGAHTNGGTTATRGRRTNGATSRPRGRKTTVTETEVIAVQTEAPLPSANLTAPVIAPEEPATRTGRGKQDRQETHTTARTGEDTRGLHDQAEETTRRLREMRTEVTQVGTEVQTLKQQAADASREFHQAGQRLLEEGRQRTEALRQQFKETQEQLQTIQQLFREAGENLVVVFGQHAELIKQQAQECGRQAQAARQEVETANGQMEQVRSQTAEARRLYETAQREALDAEKKLAKLRQEVQDARRELDEARRELESARADLTRTRNTPAVVPTAVEMEGANAVNTVAGVEEKPRLGVTVDPVAVVAEVGAATPAEQAGVQPGDVITRVNDKVVANADDLKQVIAETPAGEEVAVEVVRGSETKTFKATLPRE